MTHQPLMSALPRSGEPVPPGPPNFSEVEGGGPHHPGAASQPGAGPNPSPLPVKDEPKEEDKDRPIPGAATIPGAGPNPGVG